jgi:hypothetical protein
MMRRYLGALFGVLLSGAAVAQQVPNPAPMSLPSNNTALKALTGATNLHAERLGFYAAGDGGFARYDWSGTNCAAADDGAQVQPTGTGCWIASFGAAYDVRVWGAKVDGGATNSSAAINAAIAYAASVGGVVDLGGGTYGVCTTPVTLYSTTKRIIFRNGRLNLQTGCAVVPPQILWNKIATNDYGVSASLSDLTVDGKCVSKYVYRVDGGDHSTHRNVYVLNPAPNATIAGSAGMYINGGTEIKFGSSNFVSATGVCYNTGTLPTYGIYHTGGGNADFSGVVVINFITGIWGAGDDFFGPGTHVWSGCKWDTAGNGGLGACAFDPALRGDAGLYLNGSGHAYGVEVDDPKVAGVVLNTSGTEAADRMVAIGTACVFAQTVVAGQTCVTVTSGTGGSLVMATTAPQIAVAGFPQNIVLQQGGVSTSTTITNNPRATDYGGEGAVIHMAGVLPASPDGCIGITGYQAGATNCTGVGWITSPLNGCQVKLVQVGMTAAPGAGNSTKFTLQDNGVDTPMTGTATGAGNFGFTNNAVWDIAASHVITLRAQTTAGAPVPTQVRASLYGCG